MNIWSLDEIVSAVGGTVISKKESQFQGLGTDTRQDLTGNIFFSLRGDQFDAHLFLPKAFAQGAAGLVVDRADVVTEEVKACGTIILVADTLKALQDFAKWHRSKVAVTIVGLTGSAGKTSTKEFLATILEKRRKVFFSKGSFNNHWGVPISLLSIESTHEIALIEMGMNHPGELTSLVAISQPDIVLCTMVGPAHLEHFGTVERIAEAKEEIYLTAKPTATRIFNLDNPWTFKMFQRAQKSNPRGSRITFSGFASGRRAKGGDSALANDSAEANDSVDVSLKVESMTLDGLVIRGKIRDVESQKTVKIFGQQNCVNLMAAAAAALACGLKPEEIWQGLGECHTVWGRNQMLLTENKIRILFDGYNANPESMLALLENVSQLKPSESGPTRRIGVFGQMLEMGLASKALHETLGQQAARAGFGEVFFYGVDFLEFSKGFRSVNSTTPLHVQEKFTSEFANSLARSAKPQDLIVVKGSRGMALERMILPLHPQNFEQKS